MATEMGDQDYAGESFSSTRAAILLVIGEPISPGHKDLILAEVAKGFQSWDAEKTGVDINDELASIANSASAGEEGLEGERVIRRSSPSLQVEILVNPQMYTVRMGLKTFLTTPSQHKHLIYAGHGFQGSGAWVLQDDIFTFGNFAQIFRDPDIENALKQQEGGTLSLHCFADGEWSSGNFAKQDFGKILRISVNPATKEADNSGILRFVAYVGNFVEGRSLNKLLPASDVVGSIRFSKPTMYVFPGCQGDSALFGVNGFNLLVNAGYNRKACFWDFTRHLDRIDAMLLTHLGPDNIFGIGSVLGRKAVENIHPEIGYVYLNANDKAKHSPNGDLAPEEGGLLKSSSLKINLSEECSRLVEYCKQIGLVPNSCMRSSKGDHLEPINLYHKVGHGSLDLYVLNPVQDSKDIKEFFQHWSKHAGQFGMSQGLPLQNVLSTCALLVWTPTNQTENITRIFFPGNAPQNKIIEGLEKVKNLDFLKHPTCSYRDLHAKPARKAGVPSRAGRPASAKPSTLSSPRESMRREKMEKIEKPKLASGLKANKGIKDDSNKKTVKEKKEKQKSPVKATPNGTPGSSSTGTPGRDSPADITPVPVAPVEASLIDIQQPAPVVNEEPFPSGGTGDLLGQLSGNTDMAPSQEPGFGTLVNNDLDSPEPLPNPDAYQPGSVLMPNKVEETMAMVDEQVTMSRKTMEDLGIYDDDAEFPVNEVAHQQTTNNVHNDLADDDDFEEDVGAFENDNPEAEEIQPEALPEPIAIAPCYAAAPEVPEQSDFTVHTETTKVRDDDYLIESPPPEPELEDDSTTQTELQTSEELSGDKFPADEDIQHVSNGFSQEFAQEPFGQPYTQPEVQCESSEPLEQPYTQPDVQCESPEPTEQPYTQPEVQGESYEPMEQPYTQPEVQSESSEPMEQPYTQPELQGELSQPMEQPYTQPEVQSESSQPMEQPYTQPEVQCESSVDQDAEEIDEDHTHADRFADNASPSVDVVTRSYSESAEAAVNSEMYKDEIEDGSVQPEHLEDTRSASPQYERTEENQAESRPQQFEDHHRDSPETAETEDVYNESDEGIDAAEEVPSNREVEDLSGVPAASAIGTGFELPGQAAHQEEQNIYASEPADYNRDFELENQLTNRQEYAAHEVDQSEESSIPAAFEKDETPELMTTSGPAVGQVELERPLTPDSGDISDMIPSVADPLQDPDQRGETDSLDGDPDNEKDIDEACEDEGLQESDQMDGIQQDDDLMPSNQEPLPNMEAASQEEVGMNPFYGINDPQKQMATSGEYSFEDEHQKDPNHQPFNPLKEWGEPMGLPSPMMGEAATNGAEKKDKSPKAKPGAKTAKNGPSKPAESKTTKKPEAKKATSPNKPTSKLTERKAPTAPTRTSKAAVNGDSKPAKSLLEKKMTSKAANAAEKRPTSKLSSRPATAPARTELKKTNEKTDLTKSDPKTKPARRPASAATSRASAPAIKTMPLPPHTTFYVDLTYIPAHGDPSYSDVEFFRRVRARHYVLSALSPTIHTLNSLLEAKQTWEDKDLEVTIIPTYDSETVRHWMGLHKELLAQLKIEIAPAASRCTIQLQDHETSCSAYRMEF